MKLKQLGRSSSPSTLPDRPSPDAASVLERLRTDLTPAGLDLVVPFSLDWCTGTESKPSWPNQQGTGRRQLAVLVGNSRRLWQPFLANFRSSSKLQSSANPLDTYIEGQLLSHLNKGFDGLQWRLCWANTFREGGPQEGPQAMQRLAHMIGLAYYDRTSHLCLHPKLGAWFCMRAVVVFEDVAFTEHRPPVLKSPLSAQTQAYIKVAVRSARTSIDASDGRTSASNDGSVPHSLLHWQKWVAVREATCPGNPWRYDKHQLEYHYTQNLVVLQKASFRRSLDLQ